MGTDDEEEEEDDFKVRKKRRRRWILRDVKNNNTQVKSNTCIPIRF